MKQPAERIIPQPAAVLVDGARYDWPVRTERPWLAEIWEPLKTKAPSPALAQPYCCYINTVIFYLRPYRVREWHHLYRWKDGWRAQKPGTQFEEWDRAETVISWHTALEVNGQRFEMQGGSVIWKHRRWWMVNRARRRESVAV